MRLAFDLEANGLLRAEDGKPEITKVHCLVTQDLDSGEVLTYHDVIESEPVGSGDCTWPSGGALGMGVSALVNAELLVPHNGIGYDIPVISRFFGVDLWDPKKVFDTCCASRLMLPRIGDLDRRKGKTFPKELFGRHSLEAWGYRLGKSKGDFGKEPGAFDTLTPEMIDYCAQDVAITVELYRLFTSKNWSRKSIELEHRFAWQIARMMSNGFPFDLEAAEALDVRLEKEMAAIDARLHEALGVREIVMKTKTKYEEVNLGSSMQVVEKLKTLYGWKPPAFTPDGRAQFDETIIAELPDDIPVKPDLLARQEIKGAKQRLNGDAKKGTGLLRAAVETSTGHSIYHFCNHNGARTGRCTHSHPNVNFPRVSSPWGPEFRGMVKAPPGWVIVGCDMSGVDARAIAHYLQPFDGGKMIDMIMAGNLHDVNRDLMATVVPEITRSVGKNVFYAVCYGAGTRRVGITAKTTQANGKKLRRLIRDKVEGLEQLIQHIQATVEARGYLKGLDGRLLYPDAAFSALNTLSQGCAAVLMKEATARVMETLDDRGIEAQLILHVHDEGQILCRPKDAGQIGTVFVQCIRLAGTKWNLRCPLDGEYKVGDTWAATH